MAATTTKQQHSHRLGSIWVTPEMAAQLDRLSATTGRSINEHVREALARYLRTKANRA
jgi:predicted DNA-binding protein